jgi:plastocyanin
MKHPLSRLALALLAAGPTLAGPAGRAGATPPGRGGAPEAAVELRTFEYRPARLEVVVGTRVTWTNQDATLHTVTSGTPEAAAPDFDAPLREKGSFAHTFTKAGSYPYHCARHPFMRGEVHVTAKPTSNATPKGATP